MFQSLPSMEGCHNLHPDGYDSWAYARRRGERGGRPFPPRFLRHKKICFSQALVAKPKLSPFFLRLWCDLMTNIGSAFLVKPAVVTQRTQLLSKRGEYTICFMSHTRTTVVIPSIIHAEYVAYATFVERQSIAPSCNFRRTVCLTRFTLRVKFCTAPLLLFLSPIMQPSTSGLPHRICFIKAKSRYYYCHFVFCYL